MAKYTAAEASANESRGGDGFRLKKDGDRAKVVFLYEGPETIDGWACHRFEDVNYVPYTMDCPRSPKDPIEDCPACKDGVGIKTRIMVKMLNLDTNQVEVWDKPAGFRQELVGMMEYFKPLYSKVYEIVRRGAKTETKYQFQSLSDSGLTPEQYKEYSEKGDVVAEEYVQPVDQYVAILAKCKSASAQKEKDQVVDMSQGAPQGAWGQPPQGAWGQPPQPPVGYPQQYGAPQPPVGYPPVQQPQQPQPPAQQPQQAPPVQQPQQAPPAQPPAQGWGQPPAQGWGQPPSGQQ